MPSHDRVSKATRQTPFRQSFLHPTMMRASLLLLAVAISPIGSQLSHAEQDKRAAGYPSGGEVFVQYCMS